MRQFKVYISPKNYGFTTQKNKNNAYLIRLLGTFGATDFISGKKKQIRDKKLGIILRCCVLGEHS